MRKNILNYKNMKEVKNNMRIGKIAVLIAMALMMCGIAFGAATINTPAANGIVHGKNYDFNITADLINVSNCSITFTSGFSDGQTANVSETIAKEKFYNKTWWGNSSGYTGGASSWLNMTWNTKTGGAGTFRLEDGKYTMSGYCMNGTTSDAYTSASEPNVTAITSRVIYIDNFVPSTPTSVTPTTGTIDTDGTVTFEATVTGGNTSGCKLLFDSSQGPTPSISNIMAHLGDTCSLSVANLPMTNAGYYWAVQAHDGLNVSNSAYQQLHIKTSGNTAKKAYILQQQQVEGEGSDTVVWVVLIAIVAYAWKGKKGKR